MHCALRILMSGASRVIHLNKFEIGLVNYVLANWFRPLTLGKLAWCTHKKITKYVTTSSKFLQWREWGDQLKGWILLCSFYFRNELGRLDAAAHLILLNRAFRTCSAVGLQSNALKKAQLLSRELRLELLWLGWCATMLYPPRSMQTS